MGADISDMCLAVRKGGKTVFFSTYKGGGRTLWHRLFRWHDGGPVDPEAFFLERPELYERSEGEIGRYGFTLIDFDTKAVLWHDHYGDPVAIYAILLMSSSTFMEEEDHAAKADEALGVLDDEDDEDWPVPNPDLDDFYTARCFGEHAERGLLEFRGRCERTSRPVAARTTAELVAFLSDGEESVDGRGRPYKAPYRNGELVLRAPEGWTVKRVDEAADIRARVIALGVALPEWPEDEDE
jgi:hypothetical protein